MADVLEVLQNGRAIGELFPEIGEQAVHHKPGHLGADLLDGLLALAVQVARLAHRLFELLLELGAKGLELVFSFRVELLIVFGAHHLAVDHGRDGEADLRADQRKAALVEIGL